MASSLGPGALVLALVGYATASCTVTVVTGRAPRPLPPPVEAGTCEAARVHDVGRRTPASPVPTRWNAVDSRPDVPLPGREIRPERTPATPDVARAQPRTTRGGARRATGNPARAGAGRERGPARAADEPASARR